MLSIKSTFFFKCFFYSALISLQVISGCATSSLFSPYPAQIAKIKKNLGDGDFEASLDMLNKERNGSDKTLYMMERARVNQLKGDFDASIVDFNLAIDTETIADNKAIISASDAVAQGAALVSSDNAIPYRAASYERVLIHHYQAMNYLAKGKYESAGVEIRRAELEQREALERHHKALAKAETDAAKKNFNPKANQARLDAKFSAMYAAAGNVKNSFQNAYTFYFSAVMYEKLGQDNDAYIDYKKALEIHPDNSVLRKDVLRLAKKLDFREDYANFKKKFGERAQLLAPGYGELIVFYEESYIPVKDQIKIPLILDHTIHSVAFPVYKDLDKTVRPMTISDSTGFLGKTEVIANLQLLALKNLQEKMTMTMIRQVLRVLAKNQLKKSAGNVLGPVGEILALLYNILSERADLRSWLTLPRNIQIFRISLPKGSHEFNINTGFGNHKTLEIEIKDQSNAILYVVGTKKQVFTQVM